ncbi:MAG: DUF1501 domain-containing protein [Acidimicrobiia bacterium]
MSDGVCELVTRRQFVAGLGSAMILVACSGRTVSVFKPDTTTTLVDPTRALPNGSVGPITDKVLVVIEMGGGNDGLSMVVPHGVDKYYDLRQNIRIESPIDLDGEVGLHPELEFVASEYQAGRVAFVEGVGVPDPDLSHFISMASWWTAKPDSSDGTGWLGRYLDGTVGYTTPLAGIAIGPGPSRALLGNSSYAVAIRDETGLNPDLPRWIDTQDELMGMWAGFAPGGAEGEADPVRRAIGTAVEARDQLAQALDGTSTAQTRRPTLENELLLAARLINSGVSPTVIYIHGFGDFDTHLDQKARHDNLMTQLNAALGGFWSNLGPNANRVVTLTASEFGRRPKENGSGTDHGTAASHILMGPAITGGRYGETPSLSSLDPSGNLVHTVDYRSVYATVLDHWLEADADTILGAEYERLDVLT